MIQSYGRLWHLADVDADAKHVPPGGIADLPDPLAESWDWSG
jgi:hypothetical protein